MPARRIGCLWLPHFLVWVMQRQQPEFRRRPLIIGGTPSEPRRAVLDLSEQARAAGVRIGMTLREAQARCPDAVFLPVDADAAARAQEWVLALLERFGPDVEDIRPGVALFATNGLDGHFASEGALAGQIIATLRDALAVPARVGVAGARFCARVAAAYAAPVLVIPPGGEREFLAPLPVAHLPGLDPWRWRLQFLGIRTIGDYATRLPYRDVTIRYGAEAAQAHLLARGLDPPSLLPRRPRAPPAAVQRFDPPEGRLEPLIFALKRRLDPLCGELERDGWRCATVHLRCYCEGAEDVLFALRPAEPTASPARLRDLVRWSIERRQTEAQQAGGQLFGGGITQFELQLDDLTPASGQALNLFSGGRAGKHNVLDAIERLEALLGPESVRQATPGGGLRPEEVFTWAPYRPRAAAPEQKRPRRSPAGTPTATPAARVPPLPLAVVADGRVSASDLPGAPSHIPAMRLFDPPQPVQVRQRNGEITAVAAGRGLEAVTACAGPWRLDERWWVRSAARDYFQVATRRGRVYLLYRESDAWYLQGVFD